MRIICSWCGATIQTGPVTSATSHGICPECKAEQMAILARAEADRR